MSYTKRKLALTAQSDGKLYDHNVQTVTLSSFGGTDSFTLSNDAGSTNTTSFVRGTNATASAVEDALRTLYGRDDITVTGTTDAGPFVVTFAELDNGTAVALLSTTGTGCTGATTSPEGKSITVDSSGGFAGMTLVSTSTNATVDVTLKHGSTTVASFSQVDADAQTWSTAKSSEVAAEDDPAGSWTAVASGDTLAVTGASWTDTDVAVVNLYFGTAARTSDAPKRQNVHTVTLSGFSGTDSFKLSLDAGSHKTATLTRGTATATTIRDALRALTGGQPNIEVEEFTDSRLVVAGDESLPTLAFSDGSGCTGSVRSAYRLVDRRNISGSQSDKVAARLAARA